MSYADDLLPAQCWDMLEKEGKNALLIDVRTRAEWTFVGMPTPTPDMHPLVTQEWQIYPDMAVDAGFVSTLKTRLDELSLGLETRLCFLCRSGVRSKAAASAMTQAGYSHAYNITNGFEGDPNSEGHRGKLNGWKKSELPWRQN